MIRNERVVMNYWMVYVSIVHKLGTGTGECPRDSRDDYYRLNHYTKVKLDRQNNRNPDVWLSNYYMVPTTL